MLLWEYILSGCYAFIESIALLNGVANYAVHPILYFMRLNESDQSAIMYQLFNVRDINPQDRQALLMRFGIPDAPLFAQGTEAEVYELDAERLLKIYAGHERGKYLERLRNLYTRLNMVTHRLQIPRLTQIMTEGDCVAVVETRVQGVPLADVLPDLSGAEHERVETLYLDAVWQIGDLAGEKIPNPFADLQWTDAPELDRTFRTYYADALKKKLVKVAPTFTAKKADFPQLSEALIGRLRSIDEPHSVVHGDLFEGNILVNETATEVLGVIDFGVFSFVRGHYLLDVAGAFSYYRMYDPDRDAIRARLLAKILKRLRDDARPVFYQFLLANAIMTCDLYAGDRPLMDDGHFNWALDIVCNEAYWQGALG